MRRMPSLWLAAMAVFLGGCCCGTADRGFEVYETSAPTHEAPCARHVELRGLVIDGPTPFATRVTLVPSAVFRRERGLRV